MNLLQEERAAKLRELNDEGAREMRRAGIRTEFVYPPIPERHSDWRAYRDEEGPYGYGETEEAAIQDLLGME